MAKQRRATAARNRYQRRLVTHLLLLLPLLLEAVAAVGCVSVYSCRPKSTKNVAQKPCVLVVNTGTPSACNRSATATCSAGA